MDKMKQEVEKKLRYWRRICALFTCLVVLNFINGLKPLNAGDEFTDFFSGFQFGVAIGFLFFAIFYIIRFRKILANEESVRNYYIKEHDERNALIWASSGGTVLYTCGVLIIGAAIVAGYFNPTVFITLLLCGVFLLIIQKVLMIYYCKTI